MDSYIAALEEEKKKIMVFERELPLSLHLVIQAIESCRGQLEHQQHVASQGTSSELDHEKTSPDWLSSVRLWKQPHPPPNGGVLRKPIAVSAKRVGAGTAFRPFQRQKNDVVVAAPAGSTTENYGGEEKVKVKEKEKEEKEAKTSTSQRKARRCWSQELHRQFLHALQQLGGSHDATPKQIRELMKVDGLTNDEVKSHLQKYRLHTRRPSTTAVQNSSHGSAQTPRIVLVGGLWMPPTEYTAVSEVAVATAFEPANRLYPPASLVSEPGSAQQSRNNKLQPKRSPTRPLTLKGGKCDGDGNSEDAKRTNSDLSAPASSSQTSTSSPSPISQQQTM